MGMERFVWMEDHLVGAQCARCANYTAHGKCTAFPPGIPMAILTGEHDHRAPYPGDNGIRFEPKEDAGK